MSKSPSPLALQLYHICCQEILWKTRYNVWNLSRDIISLGDQRPLTCWMEVHHLKWPLWYKCCLYILPNYIFIFSRVITWPYDHMILSHDIIWWHVQWLYSFLGRIFFIWSHYCAKFDAYNLWRQMYICFWLCDINWPHYQRDIPLGKWKPYCARFGAHKSSEISCFVTWHHVTTICD